MGGEGGVPPGPGLTVCAGESAPQAKAQVAQDYYTDSLFAVSNCEVSGVVRSTGARLFEFYNQVAQFNFRFWGCNGPVHETEFGLVFEVDVLTQPDVDLLIDLYVAATHRVIPLSLAEDAAMRAELARIAAPLVLDPSDDTYSMSTCEGGAGGAGGGGGEGGGVGGTTGGEAGGGAGGRSSGGDGGTTIALE